MSLRPFVFCFGLFAAVFGCVAPAAADTYWIILKGTVTLPDGSPPPFTAGIERVCSDNSGSAPGPITNKKGEFTWRMEIDPLATRACVIRATHAGYTSSTLEVQGLDTTQRSITLPPLTIMATVTEPDSINVTSNNIPGKGKSAFDAAMKALDKPDFAEAAHQLQEAVKGSPKFAQGWHALGVVEDRLHNNAEAKDAFEHAISGDPKLLTAYVMLARVCVKAKDWDCVNRAADGLMKADPKKSYAEVYLHQAVARYYLKDLDGAQKSVE
jgi:hypothetical protein